MHLSSPFAVVAERGDKQGRREKRRKKREEDRGSGKTVEENKCRKTHCLIEFLGIASFEIVKAVIDMCIHIQKPLSIRVSIQKKTVTQICHQSYYFTLHYSYYHFSFIFFITITINTITIIIVIAIIIKIVISVIIVVITIIFTRLIIINPQLSI